MAKIHFTSQLERFLEAPTSEANGDTLARVLNSVFGENPRLAGYIVDDQGALRQHVAVFIDGRPVQDRDTLSDPISSSSEIHVFQALSGG